MGKRKKEKVVINNQELTPTVLGELSVNKKTSIIPLIIIFVLLITFTIFLPDIVAYIENEKESTTVTPGSNNTIVTPPIEETNKYIIESGMEIELDDIKLSDFLHVDNILSFKLTNISTESLVMNNTNYFLEIYSDKDVILDKIIIENLDLESGESLDYSKNVDADISYLKFSYIKSSDYPEFTLDYSSGIATLTCQKDLLNLVYSFEETGLVSLNESISLESTNTDFNDYYNYYTEKRNSYLNATGVTVTFNSLISRFEYIATYDLKLYNNNTNALEENYFYGKLTQENVVKYENEARGFICS